MTGLRFVAAFLVFGFHVHTERLVADGPARTAMEWVFSPGAAGVSFFFVLSGFVLTWSARPGDTARRFWRRRAARIYPDHLATWLVAVALAVAGGSGVALAVWLPNLLLVQAWSPDLDVFFGLNTVSWSLACEVFFYALFPVLYLLLPRLPGRALWPATAAALSLVWLVPVAAHALPLADRYWFIWVFPVSRLPEFAAGMLLARIVQEGRWPRRFGLAPATALAIAAYLGSRWLPDDFRIVAATVIPLALLVAAVAAADVAGTPSPWRSSRWVRLGELSYAFYLVHQLVLRLVVHVAGTGHPAAAGLGIALVSLALALAGSWLLHEGVENPAIRLLLRRRTPPATAGSAPKPRT
ncbi:acyltransferase family protein [Pseudosporangium ferrugineum]|uniref:Peptidoglycan/LPS O-acetylase OafA/YrhL n=1 Tax=Pseudosporangium ferrugineum TaxID=439699 RepID=A0A2T0SF69_9ACTN|nr:acyltransferase [Pseudosporangium ferrugineum]PRY32051.1 peptidoglycan/LPS O-acetylase OafA/YrhL [Pseudosporangium ferrugineum]